MPEIADKLKNNLKERVNAITVISDGFTDATKTLVDNLKGVKPVQGAAAFLSKFGDGTALFVKKQAEITRKWGG